ncbi:DNA cytosine methyltransferase [Stenotrophomonas sp. T8]|uniref:DNA cytosine methyltransferase n=1 Tax=Stenotrophomonas sp. T8 TaxID=3446365 RepID=UPI003F6F01E1
MAAPHLVKFRGDSIGTAATEPVPTITSGAGAARPAGAAHALGVAAASLVTLRRNMIGADARTPLTTVAAQTEHHAVSSAFMVQAAHGEGRSGGVQRWGAGSKDAHSPVGTVTASGNGGHAVAAAELAQLSPEQEAGALRVAAFLVKYYGSGIAVGLHDPVDTVTTKDRLALVTVVIKGTPYVIVDIGLRMLKPHELFRAQGFPPTYIIDRTADGTTLKTTAQVRMCGNSVSPPPFYALIDANLDPVALPLAEAA